jgi:anti-sigma factor RsiW
MNCHEVRQNLTLYLDSEGDPELHLRVSEHLGTCPACAEWFARQQRFEEALAKRLRAGQAMPELWQRVLTRAGLRPPPTAHRRRFILGAVLAAASLLLAIVAGWKIVNRPRGSELAPLAADWHRQLLDGEVRPDLTSDSDKEVEDHLRRKVPFRVHCPPRKDADFAVQGAGTCRFKDLPAAYIVGQVNQARVSLFVLDRGSLQAFPHEREHLVQGGGRHRCREGDYQMVSAVTADNVLIVVGTASPAELELLIDAYGSYHEG